MTQGTYFGPFLVSPHTRNGKRTGRWLVNIPKPIADKRTRKFFESRRLAEQFAKKMERHYKRGELTKPEPSSEVRMTFRQAVEEWKKLQKLRVSTNKKRAVSLYTDECRLKGALSFLGDDVLGDISEIRLVQYQDYRGSIGRTPATVNSDLKTIVQVLNWAKRNRYIEVVPYLECVPEKLSYVVIPTQEEVARLITFLPSRLKPVVTFISETGCRSGEAFNLTWDCVSLFEGFVKFEPKDGWTPKTRSSIRRVPISRKLIGILRQQPKDGDYVFRGKVADKPINNIKKAFATAVKKAKILRNGKPVRITPHTLRKAYATWQAIDNKVPQRLLKSLLGHSPSSQVTDKHYVIPQDDAICKAVFELPSTTKIGENDNAPNGNNLATR